MADIQFDIPSRFNVSEAETGVMFEVHDNEDNFYGKFKLRLMDVDNLVYRREMERVRREMTVASRNRPLEEDKVLEEVFLRAALVDWEITAGGKPVPFTQDNARAYFKRAGTNFVMAELIRKATDPYNFNQPKKEEVAGN